MGSMARKMKRRVYKRMYKKFCEQWRDVVLEQSLLDTQGNRFRINEARRRRHAERGNQILGRRPTFNEWLKSINSVESDDEKEEEDLSWDET